MIKDAAHQRDKDAQSASPEDAVGKRDVEGTCLMLRTCCFPCPPTSSFLPTGAFPLFPI